MKALLAPTFIVAFFILVRAGDLAFTYGLAREYIRAILYALAAILALVVVILALLAV